MSPKRRTVVRDVEREIARDVSRRVGERQDERSETEIAIARHLARFPRNGPREPDFSCLGPGCETRTSRVTDPGVVYRNNEFHCSERCAQLRGQAKGAPPKQPERSAFDHAAKAGFAERHGKKAQPQSARPEQP